MFPPFNASGVLPPYVGNDPGVPAACSPYKTDLLTVAQRFANSSERADILSGFIDYRAELKKAGISAGFQILDGSFIEDCELSRGRPPGDLDLVTFAYLPVPPHELPQYVQDHRNLFDRESTKRLYKCDAFFVDLAKDSRLIVADTIYWGGLFSHQRDTFMWKGMLQISLDTNKDVDVVATLNREVQGD